MKISDLNKRIELQSFTDVRSSGGAHTKSWTTYATVWAKIKPRHKTEIFQGRNNLPVTDHKITIRYRTGVEGKHRIKYGTRYMDIKSIINIDEASKFIELEVMENSRAEL